LKFTGILMWKATLHKPQSPVSGQNLKFCVIAGTASARSASLCGVVVTTGCLILWGYWPTAICRIFFNTVRNFVKWGKEPKGRIRYFEEASSIKNKQNLALSSFTVFNSTLYYNMAFVIALLVFLTSPSISTGYYCTIIVSDHTYTLKINKMMQCDPDQSKPWQV
jgi:hypothetical protein